MTIKNIRRAKTGELVLHGGWPQYTIAKDSLTGKEFQEMLEELKAAEMGDAATEYYNELWDLHAQEKHYDPTTGQVIAGTPSECARELLMKFCSKAPEDLYNPLHEPMKHLKKLPPGEFKTTEAAKALGQIRGVTYGTVKGHDIAIQYKGRSKTLLGGSGESGHTDRNAVDHVVDMIIDQDVKCGHLHEKNRDKRRNAIKESIYQ